MRKDNLAKLKVRAPALHRTVLDIKGRNAGTDPDELQALIDKTVREVRADRNTKGKTIKA